jgi:methylglutaconyl-CoA hydratase
MEKYRLGPWQRAKVLENQVELDIDIAHFTEKLASYNPEALVQMKK